MYRLSCSGKSARNCSFVISVVLIQNPSFTFALNAGEAEGVRLLPITKLPAGIHTKSIWTSGVILRRRVVSPLAACRVVAVCVSNGNPFTLIGRIGLAGSFISTVSPVVAPVIPSAFCFLSASWHSRRSLFASLPVLRCISRPVPYDVPPGSSVIEALGRFG